MIDLPTPDTRRHDEDKRETSLHGMIMNTPLLIITHQLNHLITT